MADSNGHGPEAIELDLDKLTIGEMEHFEDVRSLKDIIPILEKIVVGGVRHRPVTDMRRIMEAVKSYSLDLDTPN